MTVKRSYYEMLLSQYSNRDEAIALLKRHRPYLEMIPSMRRPYESAIPIPLPVVRLRDPKPGTHFGGALVSPNSVVCLPCDVAILMCDPEWKIKMGAEILVYIHRPQEDFSDLLMRWRQTQVLLDRDYEWLMPPRQEHILSEGAERIYPLFVVFEDTPKRIGKGLAGADLPFVIQTTQSSNEEETATALSFDDGLEIGD